MTKRTLYNAVTGLRALGTQEKRFYIAVGVSRIRKGLKRLMGVGLEDQPSLLRANLATIEEIFTTLYTKHFRDNPTLHILWLECVTQVSSALFGDPKKMLEEKNLKLQALPYWNPTKHKINIQPLGVVKTVRIIEKPYFRQEVVDYEEQVEPGALVHIPYSHIAGALAGVAPQLMPMPVQHLEYFSIDLEPITYTEWCSFIEPTVTSNCCHRPAAWSVDSHKLVCSKCGSRKSDDAGSKA